MPAKYRRIGVVCDPELRDALTASESRLEARTDAARLRELALIGARSIGAESADSERVRAGLDALGATPDRGDLLAAARTTHRQGRADETGTESLEWVRGSR